MLLQLFWLSYIFRTLLFPSSSTSSSVYRPSYFGTLFSLTLKRYKLGRNDRRRIDRTNCAGVATPLFELVSFQVCVLYLHVFVHMRLWRNTRLLDFAGVPVFAISHRLSLPLFSRFLCTILSPRTCEDVLLSLFPLLFPSSSFSLFPLYFFF